MMKSNYWIGWMFLVFLTSSWAMADTAPSDANWNVTWDGFVDAYYGYDFNVPPTIDRTLVNGDIYSTTFDRSNEFNINLAMVEAKITSDHIQGDLAIQTGTSVQANYAAESNGLGVVKGPLPAELIQEAMIGYQVGKGTWINAGIYPSYIGFESFISKNNWCYTRSLMSDFSPYYEAGAYISHQFSNDFSGQFHVFNGWQNIYDLNQNKAVGLQLAYNTDTLNLTYNNLVNCPVGNLLRFFNDFIVQFPLTSTFQLAGAGDIGFQQKPEGGVSTWYTGAIYGKWQATGSFSITGRLEGYWDKDQVIVVTGIPDGFQVVGASINGDLQLTKNLVWRNEFRVLASADSVFSSSNGPSSTDAFVVSSYGLSF